MFLKIIILLLGLGLSDNPTIEGNVVDIVSNTQSLVKVTLENKNTYYIDSNAQVFCDGLPSYFDGRKYEGRLKAKLIANGPFGRVTKAEFFTRTEQPDVVKILPKGSKNPNPNIVEDALNEVNARRQSRGLRPFIRDEGLRQAAFSCAKIRAERLIDGHINDFQYLPAGTTASAAGCGALEDSWGWQSCIWDEPYTYAGAAWVRGRDGKRYMHIFCR